MVEQIINVNPVISVINRVLKPAGQTCTADEKFFQDTLNILEVDDIPFLSSLGERNTYEFGYSV